MNPVLHLWYFLCFNSSSVTLSNYVLICNHHRLNSHKVMRKGRIIWRPALKAQVPVNVTKTDHFHSWPQPLACCVDWRPAAWLSSWQQPEGEMLMSNKQKLRPPVYFVRHTHTQRDTHRHTHTHITWGVHHGSTPVHSLLGAGSHRLRPAVVELAGHCCLIATTEPEWAKKRRALTYLALKITKSMCKWLGPHLLCIL